MPRFATNFDTALLFLLLAPGLASLHAQDCALAPSGLVTWWPFERDGTDQVGTNRLTFFGDHTAVTGEVGQAFHFDGLTSHA